MINLYDVISCLNMNLITHFVWYLQKEKRHNIATLSIDRYLNKEHFYEKNHTENVHQSLRPVFNFGGKPKITIPCKKFLIKLNFKKVKTLKMIKTLKKLTLFFFSNLVPFNRKCYEKKKRPWNNHQWLFRLQKKFFYEWYITWYVI